MKTVYSEAHRLHDAQTELFGTSFVPCYDQPARADAVRARINAVNLGPVLAHRDHGRRPITAVHAPDYVDFLEQAWHDWCAARGEGNAFSGCKPMGDMRRRRPRAIFGRLGYYSFDTTASITAGTWIAAYEAAQVALTAAGLLSRGEHAAFALCRPPGHHASTDYLGGYCYLNNAAIAAQSLIEQGMARVAVLDVDYHHGNGTQSIFYARDDVLFLSIHADPSDEYPFFLGHADETGRGRGDGFNVNLPLPQGADAERWFAALEIACGHIGRYHPEALVVSLGVDAYEGDPIGRFRLGTGDFLRLGQRLVALELPTLFVMEGGYNLAAIGINVSNVLLGFA